MNDGAEALNSVDICQNSTGTTSIYTKTIFASLERVSEIQQSDLYMTVKLRICEASVANLNHVRVTPAFITEIVTNKEAYIGLPLSVDIDNLTEGNFKQLGHMYDADTGRFYSTQIGSFVDFELECQNAEGKANNLALVASVRIMKRNAEVCDAVLELFKRNELKCSFEISCGAYQELDDGTLLIDANESNHFEGAAIVSYPACENAVALDLVAQSKNQSEDDKMDDIKNTEVTAESEAVIASETENAEAVETAEAEETVKVEAEVEEHENAACGKDEPKEEDAACKKKKCGEDAKEDEAKDSPEDEKKDETEDKCAEVEVAEEEVAADAVAESKDSNNELAELKKLIAEMSDSIKNLTDQVASLKEKQEPDIKSIVAEALKDQENIFVDSIKLEGGEKKYGLLESEKPKKPREWTLL